MNYLNSSYVLIVMFLKENCQYHLHRTLRHRSCASICGELWCVLRNARLTDWKAAIVMTSVYLFTVCWDKSRHVMRVIYFKVWKARINPSWSTTPLTSHVLQSAVRVNLHQTQHGDSTFRSPIRKQHILRKSLVNASGRKAHPRAQSRLCSVIHRP